MLRTNISHARKKGGEVGKGLFSNLEAPWLRAEQV